MTACPECGHEGPGRHFRGCQGPRVPRPLRKTVGKLKAARDWFERFGYEPDCISPTGREFYRFLLSEVERRQK